MQHEWIVEVLDDLSSYARENELEQLETALDLVRARRNRRCAWRPPALAACSRARRATCCEAPPLYRRALTSPFSVTVSAMGSRCPCVSDS